MLGKPRFSYDMQKRGMSTLTILFLVLLGVFIVLLVFILSYFGVFNIKESVKGTADIENPFRITNWLAKTSFGANGGIKFEIQNIGFEPYFISNIAIADCNSDNNDGQGWTIGKNERVSVTIKCTSDNPMTDGELIKKDIILTYREPQGTLEQNSKGYIKTQVTGFSIFF